MPNAVLKLKPYTKENTTLRHRELLQELYKGLVTKTLYPKQEERVDLQYDEGIDITYDFRHGKRYGLSPKQFLSNAGALQVLALEECNRYLEKRVPIDQRTRWFFASFKVKINTLGTRGGKGEKLTRTYAAGKHKDPEIMVHGLDPKYVDVDLPENTFLFQAVDKIERIVGEYKPGVAVKKQRPFLVVAMVVSIRAGLTWQTRERDVAKVRAEHERHLKDRGLRA